jgi:hypothetical protein
MGRGGFSVHEGWTMIVEGLFSGHLQEAGEPETATPEAENQPRGLRHRIGLVSR